MAGTAPSCGWKATGRTGANDAGETGAPPLQAVNATIAAVAARAVLFEPIATASSRVALYHSQKGGTGKTTLALSMATEALACGRREVVVDLDPQASACEWNDLRGEETPAVIDAQPAPVEVVVERAREHGVELLLIDTAGRTEQAALAGARVADLVLIPLQPSVVDLKSVQATIGPGPACRVSSACGGADAGETAGRTA